jgi:hypothetical protein
MKTGSSFRNYRLKLGICFGLGSKMSAVALQALALPLAIKFCGAELYATYLSLVAASLLPSVLLMRLGPAITARVAKLSGINDQNGLGLLFTNSLVLAFSNAGLSAILALIALTTIPVEHILPPTISAQSIYTTLTILACVSIGGAMFMTIETFQAGMHETHTLAIRATVSNILAAIAITAFIPRYPSIYTLILALQLIPFAARIINALAFLRNYHSYFALDKVNRGYLRNLIPDALGYTLVAGLGNYIYYQLPILLITTLVYGSIATALTIAIDVLMQSLRGLNIFLSPSIPALADAVASRDFKAFRRIVAFLILGVNATAFLLLSCLFIGSQLLQATFSLSRIETYILFLSFFVAFWAIATEAVTANAIFASGSHGEVNSAYWRLGLRSIISTAAILMLIAIGRPESTLLAMFVTVLTISVIPNTIELLAIDKTLLMPRDPVAKHN